MIAYRKATEEDVRPALDLALKVFLEFEAGEYEPEAVARFKGDIVFNQFAISNWMCGHTSMYVALDEDRIVGVVGEKGSNGHINILFVAGQYHHKGIGTRLMNHMICDLKLRGFDRITAFSSPYGQPFYRRYGFVETADVQHQDGFIFIPMEYSPKEIWDVYDSHGNMTGRFTERGRRLAPGDYHLVVQVWKHNGKGLWLIDRRSPRKHGWSGMWETTGGSALAGDDSLTAALRETKEELGIDLDPNKGTLFKRLPRQEKDGHTWLLDVWVFEWAGSIHDIEFEDGETCEAAWASADTIQEMMATGQFIAAAETYPYFEELAQRWAKGVT